MKSLQTYFPCIDLVDKYSCRKQPGISVIFPIYRKGALCSNACRRLRRNIHPNQDYIVVLNLKNNLMPPILPRIDYIEYIQRTLP